jgi:hypothetical protein
VVGLLGLGIFDGCVNRSLPGAKTGYEKGLGEEYAGCVVGEEEVQPILALHARA